MPSTTLAPDTTPAHSLPRLTLPHSARPHPAESTPPSQSSPRSIQVGAPSATTNHKAARISPDINTLKFFGVSEYPQEDVYCEICEREKRNDGAGFFLFVRFGHKGFSWQCKGKYPNERRFGALAGQRRGVWRDCQYAQCDLGHFTYLLPSALVLTFPTSRDAFEKFDSAGWMSNSNVSLADAVKIQWEMLVARLGESTAAALLQDRGLKLSRVAL